MLGTKDKDHTLLTLPTSHLLSQQTLYATARTGKPSKRRQFKTTTKPSSKPSLSPTSQPSTESLSVIYTFKCPSFSYVTQLIGRGGDGVDRIGVKCSDGTTSPSFGGNNGGPASTSECPEGISHYAKYTGSELGMGAIYSYCTDIGWTGIGSNVNGWYGPYSSQFSCPVFQRFVGISVSIRQFIGYNLWDEADNFFVDDVIVACEQNFSPTAIPTSMSSSPTITPTSMPSFISVGGTYNGIVIIGQDSSVLLGRYTNTYTYFHGYIESGTIHMTFPNGKTLTAQKTDTGIAWDNKDSWTLTAAPTFIFVGGYYNGGANFIEQSSNQLTVRFENGGRPDASGYIDSTGIIYISFPDDRTYTAQKIDSGLDFGEANVWVLDV